MWRVRNESTGKEVLYYEAGLIDKITKRCNMLKGIFNYDKSAVFVAQEILDLIEQYEKERK